MNRTLLRFGFGTMEADNFADGDKNEHIVPDYNNDKQISTDAVSYTHLTLPTKA